MTYSIFDFLITLMNYLDLIPENLNSQTTDLPRTIGKEGMLDVRGRVRLYKSRFREVQDILSVHSIIGIDDEIDWELKYKSFHIPSDFSRNELLSLGLKEKHIANVMIILSLLRISTKYKEVVMREKNSFSRINSKILSEFLLTLNNESSKFLKVLDKAGWVKIDDSYQVGVKSKGYQIGKRFKDSTWITADWRESLEKFVPEILEGSYIARWKDTLYELWPRACLYFTSWDSMAEGDLKEICKRTTEIGRKLTVVRGEALTSQIYSSAVAHIECPANRVSVGNGWTLEKQIDNYTESLANFDGKNFSTTCHDERFKFYTNRLYSNIVNLKSEFRQFIRLYDQQMVNVDIQSCQVALLSKFYKPEDAAEKEKFVNLICDADIYTHIAGGKLERKVAKLDMFRVMFDRNGNQKGEVCARFKEEFPVLTARIFDNKAKDGYKSVAREMQLQESAIMIQGVLKELLFVKKLECLSIHDSIFCLPQDAKIVEETIYSFFTAAMGFCPTIKLEDPNHKKCGSPPEKPLGEHP